MNGIQYIVRNRRFDTAKKSRAYAYKVLKKDSMRIAIKSVSPYGSWRYGVMMRIGDTRVLYREMYPKSIVVKDGSLREI